MVRRNRRLIDVETHQKVFTWNLRVLAKRVLLGDTTLRSDATMLEANRIAIPGRGTAVALLRNARAEILTKGAGKGEEAEDFAR